MDHTWSSNPKGILKVLLYLVPPKTSIWTTFSNGRRVVGIDFPGWCDFRSSKVPKIPYARPMVSMTDVDWAKCLNHLSSPWFLRYFWRPKSRHPGKSIWTTLLNGRRVVGMQFLQDFKCCRTLRNPKGLLKVITSGDVLPHAGIRHNQNL